MTKTPEELTKEWLNNKLQAGSFWFVETEDSNPEPMVVDMEGDFNDYEGNYYRPCFSKGKLKVLAPVPTYDEYKAMQAELAELKEKIKKREKLIQCLGSNIDELDVKKSVLIIENNKLRGLLKECQPEVKSRLRSLEFTKMTSQSKEPERECRRLENLLTRINTTLGGSEEK